RRVLFRSACQGGHTEVVKELLAKGANVTAAATDGNLPIHLASQNGNREVIAALLKGGADANVKNNAGQTPLQLAVRTADAVSPYRRGPQAGPEADQQAAQRRAAVDELMPVSKDISVNPTSGETLFHWSAR